MTLDFNLSVFIEEMKACKPPYRCPFDHCGKVYKTFAGIQQHIFQCKQEREDRSSQEDSKDDVPRPFFRSPQKDSLIYEESKKTVEFEADGRYHKFSIYDALALVSKEDYEASLPPELKEKHERKEEKESAAAGAAGSTPLGPKSASHKKRKAPRFSTPKVEKEENKDVQPIDKKVLKLPEACFKEIPNYKISLAPPLPTKYFDFVEKSQEELDKEVEYDMDEEDVAWLKIVNAKRKSENLSLIREDQFELLMDRLEKESYFQVASSGNGAQTYSTPVDEDAICCVCMDGEATNTNVILFCDLCNLAVHQECYGVPYIPEGQWLCRRCLQSPSRSVECCLCPNKGGAFKQTDDGRWAHVVCGLWIPEVRFANTVFLEPIDSIANIPSARWKLSCRICRQRGVGACIQCHKNSCYIAFHVTCGLLAGLHMKMETVREAGPGGTSITVRKTACCDQHTPADSDARPRLEDVAALGIVTPKSKNNRSPKKGVAGDQHHPLPILFRGLMNFSPQCPWDKVQKIASMVEIQKKNLFIQRLMAYWTLKRQTRNGVPLIRRLQFAKATKCDKTPEPPTPQKQPEAPPAAAATKLKVGGGGDSETGDASPERRKTTAPSDKTKATLKKVRCSSVESTKSIAAALSSAASSAEEEKQKKKKEGGRSSSAASDIAVERGSAGAAAAGDPELAAAFKRMLDERRRMRRLRQDLERVRLLCELIRKREQRKRDLVTATMNIKYLELNPFAYFLRKVMELVQEQDVQDIFGEPVDPADVPDYLDLIKNPMDMSTMRKKLDSFQYQGLDDLEADFTLMVNNCLSYNERDTIFYRAGIKMRDAGGLILRQARRQAQQMGFDPATGKQLSSPAATATNTAPNKQQREEEMGDLQLMKEIDGFLNDDAVREAMDSQEQLKRMLECSDKASQIHHPVAKKKRLQIIRSEIQKLRRKISLDRIRGAEEGSAKKQPPTPAGKSAPSGKNRKRARSSADEDEKEEKETKRRKEPSKEEPEQVDKEAETPTTADKTRRAAANKNSVAAVATPGVNRRNAVLFTRKKANSSVSGTPPTQSALEEKREERKKETTAAAAKGEKSAKEKDGGEVGGRQQQQPHRRRSQEEEGKEEQEEEKEPADLKEKTETTKDEFEFPEPGLPASPGKRRAETTKNSRGGRGGGAKSSPRGKGGQTTVASQERTAALEAQAARWTGGPTIIEDSALFRTYRSSGGGLGGGLDTDTDTGAESANDLCTDDDDETSSDSGEDSYCGMSALDIPLEPLDLVWAKCRGYPWYPALIINPKMPRTGYFHNGVPIPVPPVEVLQLAETHTKPHYLILFFDTKRTWQWLPRDKLEPLGVDTELDKSKLVQSKKPSEKKAVKKAYEEAILHRCRVTGETVDLLACQAKDDDEGDEEARVDNKGDDNGKGDKNDKEDDKPEATATDRSDRTPRSAKTAGRQESRTKKGTDAANKDGKK